MAPSPGQRRRKKRTDARRGIYNLGVTFYAEKKKDTSGLRGPKVRGEKKSEVEKWASIGKQIAAAMERGDERAREGAADCRFMDEQETERRRKYEELRKLVAMLLERREGWNERRHKVLYIQEVENGLQRYRCCEQQKEEGAEKKMRELVEKGVEMVKATEKRPCLKWTRKLEGRMRVYCRLKRESSFATAREAVRESCVVEKREVRMRRARDRKTEEARNERRRQARQSRRARKVRREDLIVEWRQTYEEWLREGMNNAVLRYKELQKALNKLVREYYSEIGTGDARKERPVLKPVLREFYNSCRRECGEVVSRWNKEVRYLKVRREEMANIMQSITDKSEISELIERSTAPETRESETRMGTNSKPQGTQKRCGNLEYEKRDLGERIGIKSGEQGEQDEKKGRKKQGRRELLLLWEAPPVGPPVGDGKSVFLFVTLLFS